MKVILIGSRAFDSLEYHLSDSFRALGHEAVTLDVTDVVPVSRKMTYWASRFVASYDRIVGRRLACRAIAMRPDLVVVVYRNLHPVLVEAIKEQRPAVPVVQVNPDALTNLEKQQIIAADFDHYFTKEPYMADFLRHKAGLNAHYLPEAFNPRVHQRPTIEKAVAERDADIDVLVFGSLYAYRARLVEQLLQAGIRVAVYGTEGPYLRRAVRSVFRNQYLIGDGKNRLLYGAKIVLNTFHYAEITSVNQKYFEINGTGGFQLCDYKPTLTEYTGVSVERVTYRTMPEALERIRYYLARPDERRNLADQQYRHFQQHHTFDRRVVQLLQTVERQPQSVYEPTVD